MRGKIVRRGLREAVVLLGPTITRRPDRQPGGEETGLCVRPSLKGVMTHRAGTFHRADLMVSAELPRLPEMCLRRTENFASQYPAMFWVPKSPHSISFLLLPALTTPNLRRVRIAKPLPPVTARARARCHQDHSLKPLPPLQPSAPLESALRTSITA